MRLKNSVSLLLAVAMVVSLAGCGGEKKGASGTDAASGAGTANEISVAESITKVTAPWYRGEMNVYTSPSAGMKKKDMETLVVGSGNQIIGCDPLNSQNEYPWTHNVYESLITTNWETGEAEPLLATEWNYDDEGNFHITLRENVKFHDGSILDAEDVIFTLQRNAGDNSSQVYDVCSKINFEKTVVEDDTHLVLAFDEPASSFVNALQSGYLGIMSKDFFEVHGEDYDFFEADAGTGAYKVIETVSGVSQRFERFEDYWGEPPFFKNVKAVLYKDWSVASIDFINGDVDILQSNKDFDTLTRFYNGEIDSTVVYQLPINRGYTLYISTNQGACSDENIRRAIAHAIDYEQLVYGVYQNEELGGKGQSILLPGTKYAVNLGTYEYNPELAAEYLAKAGYDTKNRLSLTIETSDNADLQSTCEIMQYYLGQIGIDLECIFEKSAAMTKALNSFEYQYDMIAYPLQYRSGHPQEALAGRDAWGKNVGEYAYIKGIQYEKLSALMSEGSTCLDETRANEIYAEIQQMFYDNVWSIPLSVTKSVVFTRDYLTGTTFTNGFCNLWQNVSVAE